MKYTFSALCLTLLLGTNVYASSINLSDNNIDDRKNSTTISGTLPTSNGVYSSDINEEIMDLANDRIDDAVDNRVVSIDFDYDTYTNDNYLSIALTNTTSNVLTKTNIDTIVIDTDNGDILDLDDFLDEQNLNIHYVNDYIDNFMDNENYNFNSNFDGVDSDTSYYFDDDELILAFDGYEFIDDDSDVFTLSVPLSSADLYKLDSDDYYINNSFSLKMVPLREVAEAFDYSIGWHNGSVIVSNDDTEITFQLDSNIFTKNNRNTPLEATAVINDDTTYVPITFFTELLDINYSVDNSDDITFIQ